MTQYSEWVFRHQCKNSSTLLGYLLRSALQYHISVVLWTKMAFLELQYIAIFTFFLCWLSLCFVKLRLVFFKVKFRRDFWAGYIPSDSVYAGRPYRTLVTIPLPSHNQTRYSFWNCVRNSSRCKWVLYSFFSSNTFVHLFFELSRFYG